VPAFLPTQVILMVGECSRVLWVCLVELSFRPKLSHHRRCAQGIVERGVHAEGVGWLLRGYYRDHGRFMNAEELGYFQNVLTCSSGELRMYLGADLIRSVGLFIASREPQVFILTRSLTSSTRGGGCLAWRITQATTARAKVADTEPRVSSGAFTDPRAVLSVQAPESHARHPFAHTFTLCVRCGGIFADASVLPLLEAERR
jgi:hypothetical protein